MSRSPVLLRSRRSVSRLLPWISVHPCLCHHSPTIGSTRFAPPSAARLPSPVASFPPPSASASLALHLLLPHPATCLLLTYLVRWPLHCPLCRSRVSWTCPASPAARWASALSPFSAAGAYTALIQRALSSSARRSCRSSVGLGYRASTTPTSSPLPVLPFLRPTPLPLSAASPRPYPPGTPWHPAAAPLSCPAPPTIPSTSYPGSIFRHLFSSAASSCPQPTVSIRFCSR